MGQSIETFERKEVKYRLKAAQRRALWERMAPLFAPDVPAACAAPGCEAAPSREAVPTQVMSLYYDTPERALIARSLEKPLYKEKLRVRSYGSSGPHDRVYVELKKKLSGVVYKRRVPMSLGAARLFMRGVPYAQACAKAPLPDAAEDAESHTATSLQIARELEAFMTRHPHLSPSMGTVVLRRAYVSDPALAGSSVRVTFDDEVRYFDARGAGAGAAANSNTSADIEGRFFSLRGPAPDFPELIPGETIMEVKVLGAFPLWLSRILAQDQVRPCSFSKYGQAYLTCRNTAIPARAEDGADNGLPSSLISFPVAGPPLARIPSLAG